MLTFLDTHPIALIVVLTVVFIGIGELKNYFWPVNNITPPAA